VRSFGLTLPLKEELPHKCPVCRTPLTLHVADAITHNALKVSVGCLYEKGGYVSREVDGYSLIAAVSPKDLLWAEAMQVVKDFTTWAPEFHAREGRDKPIPFGQMRKEVDLRLNHPPTLGDVQQATGEALDELGRLYCVERHYGPHEPDDHLRRRIKSAILTNDRNILMAVPPGYWEPKPPPPKPKKSISARVLKVLRRKP
jgi:hypothetical protein